MDTGAVVAVIGFDVHNFTNVMYVPKGIVWLLFATVAEIIPTVRSEFLDILLRNLILAYYYLMLPMPQVLAFSNLNGIPPFPTVYQRWMLI